MASGWWLAFKYLAWSLLEPVFMKTVVNKVNRSGVYYLMTTVATADQSKSARFDTWGAFAVVLLLLGVVGLMKLVLTV